MNKSDILFIMFNLKTAALFIRHTGFSDGEELSAEQLNEAFAFFYQMEPVFYTNIILTLVHVPLTSIITSVTKNSLPARRKNVCTWERSSKTVFKVPLNGLIAKQIDGGKSHETLIELIFRRQ